MLVGYPSLMQLWNISDHENQTINPVAITGLSNGSPKTFEVTIQLLFSYTSCLKCFFTSCLKLAIMSHGERFLSFLNFCPRETTEVDQKEHVLTTNASYLVYLQ